MNLKWIFPSEKWLYNTIYIISMLVLVNTGIGYLAGGIKTPGEVLSYNKATVVFVWNWLVAFSQDNLNKPEEQVKEVKSATVCGPTDSGDITITRTSENYLVTNNSLTKTYCFETLFTDGNSQQFAVTPRETGSLSPKTFLLPNQKNINGTGVRILEIKPVTSF